MNKRTILRLVFIIISTLASGELRATSATVSIEDVEDIGGTIVSRVHIRTETIPSEITIVADGIAVAFQADGQRFVANESKSIFAINVKKATKTNQVVLVIIAKNGNVTVVTDVNKKVKPLWPKRLPVNEEFIFVQKIVGRVCTFMSETFAEPKHSGSAIHVLVSSDGDLRGQ